MNHISIAGLIFVAALSRLIPHPPNVTPLVGISLMSGLLFRNAWAAYLIPLVSLVISDSIIGFHTLSPLIYALFISMTWASRNLVAKLSFGRTLSAAFLFSLFFFLVSNVGVWAFGGLYSLSAEGLTTCFTLALPFFGNSILGDIGYTLALYLSYQLSVLAQTLVQRSRPATVAKATS